MGNSNSVQEKTFLLLRNQIINMELLPGATTSVYEVSTALDVSRTPVREAFIRLSTESLVKVLPQRKTEISKIDFQRVREERFMRVALELAALPEFLRRMQPEHIAEMRRLIALQREAADQGAVKELLIHDDAFHAIIFQVAGQTLSWNVIHSTSGHDRRVRMMMIADYGEAQTVISEHEGMIRAFEAGDGTLAMDCARHHLQKLITQEAALRQLHPGYFE